MTVHREPATGYTSDAKQEYREKVWKSFARRKAIHYANVYDNAYILIMPGLGTEEIDTAVDYGMDPEKIICVHESAAHVAASAKWRKKYPNTPFYCCKISEVMEKLVRDKRYLTGANLDFCNNLSPELIYEVQRFMVPGIIDSGFVLQINIMAARESKMATAIIDANMFGLYAKHRDLFEIVNSKLPSEMNYCGAEYDEFISDNMPVYDDIECKRIAALLLSTLAIDLVSNPINCFIDMQGKYTNNKAPMSHVSIVIGYESRKVGSGAIRNKFKEIKTHRDDCESRIINARHFIECVRILPSNVYEVDSHNPDCALVDHDTQIDVEEQKDISKDHVKLGERDAIQKLRVVIFDKIINTISDPSVGAVTRYDLCNICESLDVDGWCINRTGIYGIIDKMIDDGVIAVDLEVGRRWGAVTIKQK